MARARSAAAIVLALAIPMLFPGAVAKAAAQGTMAAARARLAAGDREGTRTVLDHILAADSLEATARTEVSLLRAMVEEDGARYEERLRDLQSRGLRRDRQAWVHLALGQIAYLRNDFPLALREFRKAREGGDEENGSLWEGLTAFVLGDLEVARSSLLRAQDSGNRAVHQRAALALGDLDRAVENWEEARRAYQKAREEGPEGPGWWATATLREAECLDRLGAAPEADALRREVLETRPDAYEAPLALARLALASAGQGSPSGGASSPEAGTYAVQVGAFADAANAEALLRALEARGVRSLRVVRGEDGLSRVLAGSGLDRHRAESLGDSLGNTLGVGFSLAPEGSR